VLGAGRQYRLTINSATVPQFDSTGSSWDGFGGAPDPQVDVIVDGSVIGSTGTRQDVFTPSWSTGNTFTATFQSTSVLRISLYDEDVSDWEFIDRIEFLPGGWISVVKNNGYSGPLYTGSTSTISFTLAPL
jgi:hypothetical protein